MTERVLLLLLILMLCSLILQQPVWIIYNQFSMRVSKRAAVAASCEESKRE